MGIKEEITRGRDPIKLKSFLIITAAAFLIYPTHVMMIGRVYLYYDNQWWFESIDWSRDAIDVLLQIFPWSIFIVIIPGIVGIYGGCNFFWLRKQILRQTLKAVPRKITIGVVYLWIPWTVLGIFMLPSLIDAVVNYHDPVLLFVQNFVFIPLATLFTLNLPGTLSLYVYRLRKEYERKY